MKEMNYDLFKVKKYCAICDLEHDINFKVRHTYSPGERIVHYVETYFHCEKQDYETIRDRFVI